MAASEKGIWFGAQPSASVTAPCDGWVVYAGPFRSYGQLLIINAGGGYHVVLAGMDADQCRPRPVRADGRARGGDGNGRDPRCVDGGLPRRAARPYMLSSGKTVFPSTPLRGGRNKGEKARG